MPMKFLLHFKHGCTCGACTKIGELIDEDEIGVDEELEVWGGEGAQGGGVTGRTTGVGGWRETIC